MMCIRSAHEGCRDKLLAYLEQQPLINTFLLADIEKYGFNQPFQQVWLEEKNGALQAVYLRFYQNIIVYSHCNHLDAEFVQLLIEQFDILLVMGRGADMDCLSSLEHGNWSLVKKGFYSMPNDYLLPEPTALPLRTADCGDVDLIHNFLCGIEGFAAMYASRDMLYDRIHSGDGIHLLYEKNGKLISHANSTTPSRYGAILGGVATAPEVRHMGHASAVVVALSRQILSLGLQPCVLSAAPSGQNLFESIGFTRVEDWNTIERTTVTYNQ